MRHHFLEFLVIYICKYVHMRQSIGNFIILRHRRDNNNNNNIFGGYFGK